MLHAKAVQRNASIAVIQLHSPKFSCSSLSPSELGWESSLGESSQLVELALLDVRLLVLTWVGFSQRLASTTAAMMSAVVNRCASESVLLAFDCFGLELVLLFGAFLFFPAAGFLCLTGEFFGGTFLFFNVVAWEGWSFLADFPGGDVFFEHGGMMFAVTCFLHYHFLVTCYVKCMRSYSY